VPEETERFVSIPAKGMADHTRKHPSHKIVTKTLSKREGISALYCVTCAKIATYLFEKAKGWTMSKAKAWMKQHKAFSLVEVGEAGPVFRRITESGTEDVTVPVLADEMKEQEAPEKIAAENRTIFMFSAIEDGLAELMCRRLLALDKISDTEPITIIISSFGGSVYASFAITDMMEYIRAPIVTIGIGKIMSAGLMIFMAGDERLVSQNVNILAHRFSAGVGGTQAEIKARQREFDIIHDQMVAHFIKHCNLTTKEEIEDTLLRETDTYLTPEELMQYGIADRFFDKADDDRSETPEQPESISPPLTPSADGTVEGSSANDTKGPLPGTGEAPEQEIREAIGGSRTLPLDKSSKWDGSAAEGRIRRWAGGPKKEEMEWARYRRAFVWYDPKQKDAFAGYKLPFADVTGGKLTAVWGGVSAAMAAVLGSRGGVNIPDKRAAYNFLAGYYRKFEKKPPKYHTSQSIYGFYGYGQYGYVSAQFQKALILLKRMITADPDSEKLRRAYRLLDPAVNRRTAFKAIDSTMTAVATLQTVKGTKGIIDLVRTTRGEVITRTPRIIEGKPMAGTWAAPVDSVDWVESDRNKPFRFSGIALRTEAVSGNGRYYPRKVVETAVAEAQQEASAVLTICAGHPDEEDTSPMSIVGKVPEIQLNDQGEVTFVGEIVDTRLGEDVRKLLRFLPAGTQPLSLRASGSTVYETVGGSRRERVLEMHFRGFDLVRHGGVVGAAVQQVLESGGE